MVIQCIAMHALNFHYIDVFILIIHFQSKCLDTKDTEMSQLKQEIHDKELRCHKLVSTHLRPIGGSGSKKSF